MKLIRNNYLGIILSAVMFTLVACADEKKSDNVESGDVQTQTQTQTQSQTQPQLQTNTQNTPPAPPSEVRDENGDIVYHYTCPDNCEGGGASAQGNCSVCGKELQHNNLYHTYMQQNTPPTQGLNQQTNPASPQQQMTPPPAQNANGVWHYTCPNGCEGGAGSQGTCAKCGGALAHNQAYHNQ